MQKLLLYQFYTRQYTWQYQSIYALINWIDLKKMVKEVDALSNSDKEKSTVTD